MGPHFFLADSTILSTFSTLRLSLHLSSSSRMRPLQNKTSTISAGELNEAHYLVSLLWITLHVTGQQIHWWVIWLLLWNMPAKAGEGIQSFLTATHLSAQGPMIKRGRRRKSPLESPSHWRGDEGNWQGRRKTAALGSPLLCGRTKGFNIPVLSAWLSFLSSSIWFH